MLRKNKIISTISPVVRLIVLLTLVFSIIIAKSIYLVLFITTITLIFLIITGKKTVEYVKFIKRIYLLLLIFFIAYIIICGEYNFLNILFVFYKILLISFSLKIFELNTSFDDLHESLYGTFYIFRKLNIEKFSLNLVISIYFIKFWFDSKDEIKNIQSLNDKKKRDFIENIKERVIYSIYKLNKLQLALKLNFYKLKYKKLNMKSKVIAILFILFLVSCIFKEVIL